MNRGTPRLRVDPHLRLLPVGVRGKRPPFLLVQTSGRMVRLEGIPEPVLLGLLKEAPRRFTEEGLLRWLCARTEPSRARAWMEQLQRAGILWSDRAPAPGHGGRHVREVIRGEGPALYPRLLVLGSGPLAQGLFAGLSPHAQSVRTLPSGVRPAQLAKALGEVDLLVFAPEVGTYGDLLRARAVCERAGTRLLPVTAEGPRVEVGPLLLPSFGEGLERGRLHALLGVGGLERLLSKLELPSHAALTEAAVALAADAVAAALKDPTHSLLERSVLVGPEGAIERLLPELPPGHRVEGRDWELSLAAHLHPRLQDKQVTRGLAAALARGELVVIRDAMVSAYADGLYAEVAGHPRWRVHEDHAAGFGYRYHLPDERPAAVRALHLMLGSEASLALATRLTGARPWAMRPLNASWYAPGDSTTPHTDGSHERQTAFVWHLTRGWEESWGGEFFWCPTGTLLPASFNTLSLFRVTHQSAHLVMPVGPRAQGKRLALFGWYAGPIPKGFRGAALPARALPSDPTVLTLESHPCRRL